MHVPDFQCLSETGCLTFVKLNISQINICLTCTLKDISWWKITPRFLVVWLQASVANVNCPTSAQMSIKASLCSVSADPRSSQWCTEITKDVHRTRRVTNLSGRSIYDPFAQLLFQSGKTCTGCKMSQGKQRGITHLCSTSLWALFTCIVQVDFILLVYRE